MRRPDFAQVTTGYLAAVLVAGGASAAGFAANALLQLGGAILIAACIWRPEPRGAVPPTGLRWFIAALVVLAVVQFLPLPFGLWRHLPGRGEAATAMALLDAPKGWSTVSFSPWASLASMVWWIPAAALFCATLRSDSPSAPVLVRTVLAVALGSVALAIFQRGGDVLYLYEITNFGAGTGFFANANHQASFLLGALALWSALFVSARAEGIRGSRDATIGFAYFAVALVLVAGVLLTGSVAGIGLLFPVTIGALLVTRPDLRLSPRLTVGIVALLSLAALGLALSGILQDNFSGNAGGEGHNRLDYLITGIQLLGAVAPLGSGLGTFVDFYPWFETPAAIGPTYVNHAHNDLLELLIETGLFGLAALVLFLAWWVGRARSIWRAAKRNPYAQAATILTGAVLVHSLVDYPLRTAAVSGLFAVACALIVRPYRAGSQRRSHQVAVPVEASVVI
jgi:O-antigen ligase